MIAVYAALVHHPVRDRAGDVITTSVTNLDVHDLSRSARTYDLEGLFIVTPIEAQRVLVQRILDHWIGGPGERRTPERTESLRRVHVVESLEAACAEVEAREGATARRLSTAARSPEGTEALTFGEARTWIAGDPAPVVVVFGTGHGLTHESLRESEALLEPIRARGSYNHLSVRAAAAIVFDRLFGE